jgi:hypothetical protein
MKRGRPFEPGNQFGRGRPLGGRNKKTLAVQQLLEEHSGSVLRKALVMALEGDSPMLQTLLSYILARPKDSPLKTGKLRTRNGEGDFRKFRCHSGKPCRRRNSKQDFTRSEFARGPFRLPAR